MENFIPLFRALLFFFLCVMCMVPFVWLADMHVLPVAPSELLADMSSELSIMFATLGGLLMMFKLFPFLDFYTVFIRRELALQSILKGSIIGSLVIAACSGALYFSGFVVFKPSEILLSTLALYILYYLLIAISEEFLFRSFVLLAFAERYPLWFACVFNGLLFVLVHGANPNLSTVGLTNIFLVGVLLSIYTLQQQNIFWAVGIHFGWNLTQGLIFGYHVSGIIVPGILQASPKGLSYFSGGDFGLEGSLYTTAVLIFWIIWLVVKKDWGSVEICDPKLLPEIEIDT
jgi:membrane protease YdiL (CAAX protease family)